MKWLAELKLLIPLVVIVGLVIMIPQVFREDSIIGEKSYYYLRIAEDPLISEDPLSFGGRRHVFNPYPIIITFVGSILGLELASKIVPLIVCLMIVVIFYFILRFHGITKTISVLSILLLAGTPSFLYLANVSDTHSVVLLLILLAYFSQQLKNTFFSTFFLLPIPLFGINYLVIVLFLLMVLWIHSKKIPSIQMVGVACVGLIPLIRYGLPVSLSSHVLFPFFEFGVINGVSLFVLFLTIVGFHSFQNTKYQYASVYALVIGLFVLSLFTEWGASFLMIPASPIAILGLQHMFNDERGYRFFRNAILILAAAGVVLSSVLAVGQLVDAEPSKDVFSSLEFLRGESKTESVVLSHPDNGFWISAISRNKNVIDEHYYNSPNLKERWYDIQTLFHTTDIDEAEKVIRKYNIKYFYIDKDMKSGQVWDGKTGLLFLFGASNKFNIIYESEEVEIWKSLF
ncbi:MAG: hypothetical protein AABW49_02015 [Nanoarchaeota archaeon]